jgi:parvulin-like peptidyl-prolyl isomerase
VETQDGFHIIRVDSREEADPDLVRQYLEGEARSEVIDTWFLNVIEAATVTVDESVGTWTTDPSPTVLPPA